MRFLIVVIALAASAYSYKLNYRTADHGRFETGIPGKAVQGSFRYYNDDGDKVTVEYVADHNGFRVTDTDVDHDDDDDDHVSVYYDDKLKSAYVVKYDDDHVSVYYDDKLKSAYVVKYDDDDYTHLKSSLHHTQNPNVHFKSKLPLPKTTYTQQYVPYKVDHTGVKYRTIQTPEGYYPYEVSAHEVEFKRLHTPGPIQLVPFKLDDDEVKFRPVPVDEATAKSAPVAEVKVRAGGIVVDNAPVVPALHAQVRKDNVNPTALHPLFPYSLPKGAVVVVEHDDDRYDDDRYDD